jgi:hypothetical protein
VEHDYREKYRDRQFKRWTAIVLGRGGEDKQIVHAKRVPMMAGEFEIFRGPGFVRTIDDNFVIDRAIPRCGDGAVKSTWATASDGVVTNRRTIYLDREIACGRSSDPHN